MTTLYYWRIRCDTDDKYEYIWDEDKPTVCPANNTHTIDATKTSIINKVDENSIKIREETILTGGNFRCTTKSIDIGPSEVVTEDFTWKIPISIFAISFATKDIHEGDSINVIIAPETTVGLLNSDVNIGETVLPVTDTVVNNVMLGYNITIDDGVNSEKLGEVIDIDTVNNTITVENATTNNYLAVTPTNINICVCMMKNYTIGPAWNYSIGESKIGGSYIDKGTIVRVKYTNNSTDTKKLIVQIEYTY